eukprot:scaffold1084_cov29-Cyclotella_meneghiniana.AAC.1
MKSSTRRLHCLLASLATAACPSTITAFAPPRRLSSRSTAATTEAAPPKIITSRSLQSKDDTSTDTDTTTSTVVQSLTAENALLKSRLKLLQSQNDELSKTLRQQQQQHHHHNNVDKSTTTTTVVEQRLILEDFEGENNGYKNYDWDNTNKQTKKRSLLWGDDDDDTDDDTNEAMNLNQERNESDNDIDEDELGLDSDAMTAPEYEEEEEAVSMQSNILQSQQLEDDEDGVCEYNEQTNKWTSSSTLDECPVEPNISFLDALKSRANWLVGLLALQSCSGFILARNEVLLQDHPVIIYFLTMLVGAGGNAGNQASVRVIRGLALGTLNQRTQNQFLSREFRMACALSTILSVAGFLRAIAFHTPFPETLARLGVDPAHSSTTIQSFGEGVDKGIGSYGVKASYASQPEISFIEGIFIFPTAFILIYLSDAPHLEEHYDSGYTISTPCYGREETSVTWGEGDYLGNTRKQQL